MCATCKREDEFRFHMCIICYVNWWLDQQEKKKLYDLAHHAKYCGCMQCRKRYIAYKSQVVQLHAMRMRDQKERNRDEEG